MITKEQAHEVVDSIKYRDWKFAPVGGDLPSLLVTGFDSSRVYVEVSYTAPNSLTPSQPFNNSFVFSFKLPETEAEVARAVFEAITVIEDHERREFFQVDHAVIQDRRTDKTFALFGDGPTKDSPALFHPHGFNRNAMFHALDPFAEKVRGDLMAYGNPMTADAV